MWAESPVGRPWGFLWVSSPWWVTRAVPTLRPGVWENSQTLHFERHLWELKQVTLSQWVWRWCPWQEAGDVSVVCSLSQQATLSPHSHLVHPSWPVRATMLAWGGLSCPPPVLLTPLPREEASSFPPLSSLLALLLWTSSDFPLDIFLCLESSAC